MLLPLDRPMTGGHALRQARHGIRRRPVAAGATVLLVLAATLSLSSCGFVGKDVANMAITVTNRTGEDLVVRLSGTRVGHADAGESRAVVVGGNRADCQSDINAVTDDGSEIALHEDEVCDGDTWVIEPADLVAIEDTAYASPPSP